MIAVHYNRDGTVNNASRYMFRSAKNVHLLEQTRGTGKKADILGWLCED
jgi:hypothetical protein